MKVYVKVSATDGPYLSNASTEALDGYVAKEGLTDNQAITVLSRPDKCYLDDNGVVIVPNQIPLSQADRDYKKFELQLSTMSQQITDMQATIDDLTKDKVNLQTALTNANTDNTNLKAQIQALQKQALMYTQQIMQINNDLQKAKEGK
ncbi:MAG: hypothetical protein M3Z82_03235 [Apilactobacillus sp.]|nr:hypothetical protein [Apilactobacillus sp.]